MNTGQQHQMTFFGLPRLLTGALATNVPAHAVREQASPKGTQAVRSTPKNIFAHPYIFSHPFVPAKHLLSTQLKAALGISTLFAHKVIPDAKVMLLAGILAGGILIAPARAQTAAPAGKSPAATGSRRYGQNRLPPKARQYYALIWGVDSLAVKSVESGELIRFTYRVLDAEKAKPLNDKKNEPSLIDPGSGVKLVVPSLEKVGKLRQSSTPQAGKVYWMAFSNKGGYVKRGHRVNVVIGQFRADGLVVQ